MRTIEEIKEELEAEVDFYKTLRQSLQDRFGAVSNSGLIYTRELDESEIKMRMLKWVLEER